MNRSAFPSEMLEYFNLRWCDQSLWALDLPIQTGCVESFQWHLDCPFWASNPPDAIFDLCPRRVLNHPQAFPDHYLRIHRVDTAYPLETAHFGGRLVILDGIHRLAKQVLRGEREVHYRIAPCDSLRPNSGV